MMQLVNDSVVILNPTKDNLILDAAGVEAALGVPPERVIDVMALRGDAIDNIPGAPGIGDKGSVELIQQFGSVEAALDAAISHPDQVKRKTYRESLQNNRDNILLSKELVTIHTGVPINYDIEQMATQTPDNAPAATSSPSSNSPRCSKNSRPAVDNTPIAYNLSPTQEQIAALLADARSSNDAGELKGLTLAIFEDTRALAEEIAPEEADSEPEPPPAENMNLFGAPDAIPAATTGAVDCSLFPDPCSLLLGLSTSDASALVAPIDTPGLREALEDPALPKHVHDLKAVLRLLAPQDITLAGVRDDVMLYSYLINPTHASHTLSDVTARFTHRALAPVPKQPTPEQVAHLLPEAANATQRLSHTLREQVEAAGLKPIYETMDLPLVPVLLRMEQAGVRIDSSVLSTHVQPPRHRYGHPRRPHLRAVRPSLQHQLPQAAWRRALQQNAAAQAHEVRQGQGRLHRAGRTRGARRTPHRSRARTRVSSARQAAQQLHRAASRPRRHRGPRSHHLQPGRHRHRPSLLDQPQSAEHPPPAPRSVARFAPPSSRPPATSSCPPTTRRSSCA